MYLNLQKKKCFFGLLFNKLLIVDFFFLIPLSLEEKKL